MSFISAKEHLKKYHLEDKIIEVDLTSATVALAAQSLHCKEADIAKTMGFLVNEKPILIVSAGDQKIDNHKYKEQFHTKAKMISSNDLIPLVGHEMGGVCPFGVKEDVTVYLDISLKKHDIVYPACGSHNTAVKLTLQELEKSSNYLEYIDVCKKIENEK